MTDSDDPIASHVQAPSKRADAGAAAPTIDGRHPGAFVRQARRLADLSQRELAKLAGVSVATVAGIESGARQPSFQMLVRLLGVGGLSLTVVDADGRRANPLDTWDNVRDLAGRRFPAHLDTILDPKHGEWWADVFGLARPPETFRRNRAVRDYHRRLSRWQVRVAQTRDDPQPRPPRP